MNKATIAKELEVALRELEEEGAIVVTTPMTSTIVDRLREALETVLAQEIPGGNRNARINAALTKVVAYLQQYFGHSEKHARELADAFHAKYENTRSWADDDYYDHESPQNIALEVQYFGHLRNQPYAHDMKYLDWRRSTYRRVGLT